MHVVQDYTKPTQNITSISHAVYVKLALLNISPCAIEG